MTDINKEGDTVSEDEIPWYMPSANATGIGDAELLLGKIEFTEYDKSCGSTDYKTLPSGLLTPQKKDEIAEVLEQRGNRYGKFADNANVAQNIKRAMHTPNFNKLSADKQEALEQIASKISRIVTANCSEYKDSWTDIAGYAKLVADTLED